MATKKKNNVKKNKGTTAKNKIQNEKRKIEQIDSGFDSNVWHYITVISIVIIFICAFYLLTLYITSKNGNNDSKKDDTESTTSEISYSDIMIGRSFSISDGEYYVVYYDKTDDSINSSLTSVVSDYKSKEEHLDIYSVNMGDGLNKKYAKDESNHNPSNASEFAISGPTLIKFSDGEVVDYVEGIDEITDYLQ